MFKIKQYTNSWDYKFSANGNGFIIPYNIRL